MPAQPARAARVKEQLITILSQSLMGSPPDSCRYCKVGSLWSSSMSSSAVDSSAARRQAGASLAGARAVAFVGEWLLGMSEGTADHGRAAGLVAMLQVRPDRAAVLHGGRSFQAV